MGENENSRKTNDQDNALRLELMISSALNSIIEFYQYRRLDLMLKIQDAIPEKEIALSGLDIIHEFYYRQLKSLGHEVQDTELSNCFTSLAGLDALLGLLRYIRDSFQRAG